MSKNFWDFSELNFIDVFKNAMRKTMSFDALGGPEFIAKVLTRPVPLSPAEVNAFFGSQSQQSDVDLAKKLSKFVFIGRIERIHGAFLKDPCDLATASEEEKQAVFDLISQHTKFYSLAEATEFPAIGDLVKIRLKEGDNGAWNLQSGEYIGIFESGVVSAVSATFNKGCASAAELFGSADSEFLDDLIETLGSGRIEAIEDPEIEECADEYDNNSSIAYKSRNDGIIATLHKSFQSYAKCFIYKCYEKDIQIKLNSSYRSLGKQQRLLNAWERSDQTGPKPAPPGTSYHNYGLAFDFNAIANGKEYGTGNTMDEWKGTGIVDIGESLGLRWGGFFSNNYDPIHFDVYGKWRKSTFDLRQLTQTQRVAGNQIVA